MGHWDAAGTCQPKHFSTAGRDCCLTCRDAMPGMDCPGLPAQEGCYKHASSAASTIEVTGQSGQPRLHTALCRQHRLVAPDSEGTAGCIADTATHSHNIVPAGLQPPNLKRRTRTRWRMPLHCVRPGRSSIMGLETRTDVRPGRERTRTRMAGDPQRTRMTGAY